MTLLLAGCGLVPGEPLGHFVRRDGDRLMDGGREFRFISFNIPNLHFVEDDMRFDQRMPFRLPDDYEIEDALATIEQMGGQVVRMYALPVKRAGDPADVPRYILGPGKFNEEAFVVLDRVLASARRHRVRVILPFVDKWSWWGGKKELAAWRGKQPEDCWTDPQLIEDYEQIIAFVVNRRNTVTGIPYREDPVILAWETGNELDAPSAWTRRIAARIKSLDRNHLVIDGTAYDTLPEDRLNDPNVDFVQTHHYEKDPREMIARIQRNWKLARGRRPYHVGEFGFVSTEALRAAMDTVIEEGISGALLWSLRYRDREGGFYWHHEPYGGDFFKAYHWPGFEIGESFDERGLMQLVRAKAYQIRGLVPPPVPRPAPPRLLAVSDCGMMTWQGPAGAASYEVARAEGPLGPWSTVAAGVSDAQCQYRPQFVDESVCPGKAYYYRVAARNPAGRSPHSNTVGPVLIACRVLVDELWNDSRIFFRQGKLQFQQNEARKFKEDCHRLSGEKGSAIIYHTPDPIRAVRLFVYSHSDRPDVNVAFSADGRDFEQAETEVSRTATFGEAEYDFWKADLHSVRPAGADCRYLRIEFQTDGQIGRLEIEYGKAE